MSDKNKNDEIQIETLSDDDLDSVAGGMEVGVENTGSGTCCSNPDCTNTGSGTCEGASVSRGETGVSAGGFS